MSDRNFVTAFIKEQTRMRVQSGPFAGMLLHHDASWGDGDLAPKLLGTYEQDLHPYLLKCSESEYSAIIDIGCAEGYYAVGAARLFPNAKVFAFDTDAKAISVAKKNSVLNDVSNRIVFDGECTSDTLVRLTIEHANSLIICDCEGGELPLFAHADTQARVQAALRMTDIVIECHDFLNPITTACCFAAFSKTHIISNVYSGGRNPNEHLFLSTLDDPKRWAAINENRPCLMNWLVCYSRARCRLE